MDVCLMVSILVLYYGVDAHLHGHCCILARPTIAAGLSVVIVHQVVIGIDVYPMASDL